METAPNQTQRIIDANLNRIGEGLRFLEDVGRLILNDKALSQQLKNMRHELVRMERAFNQELIQARDAAGDVGVDLEVPGEDKQRALPEGVIANSRRVQESLRVMEELAKLPGSALDSEKFKQARFALYTIEKELLSKLLRRDKIGGLSGLYVIIDTQALKGRRHVEVAHQAIRGGARIIQLHDKLLSKRDLVSIAQELKNLCAEQNVLFIINDCLDLVLAVGADGLHLGQDDLPAEVARKLLPIDKILGVSVTTLDQAASAQAEGADYVSVGPLYPSPSREKAKLVSLEVLRRIKEEISLPLVAVGGINEDNAAEVWAAGADAVAVLSAVLGADDVAEACRKIARRFEVSK